ncbi:peptidoglycan-binding protein [Planotetraspora mira]|uniref:CHAP domain-containing protein n=1 Tax=Planotetraspora mira TaxID=58121 RepID=A0A8J3TUD9_9ACTN|nr:peptidoglycan-binding protein [Planotetraspora mira]GII32683.1 hypothetical protein Pmi06nite_61250 [Planotetraspora mira]
MPRPSELLKEMTRYLGYAEPAGGRTVFGASFRERKDLRPTDAWDKGAWCDMYVAQCALAAGGKDMLAVVGDFAWTVGHAQWFKDNGRWHAGTAGIRAGDIVFFDWAGGKKIDAIDHVATVEKVHSARDIQTIDGNIGDSCVRNRRTNACVVGFGRPAYDGRPSVPNLSLAAVLAELGDAPGFPGTVQQGHKGANVRRVQEKLRRRRFKLGPAGVDADFGPDTRAAVRGFQESQGMDATGVVDKRTWVALWEARLKA